MTVKDEFFVWLALGLIQNSLDDGQKQAAQRLIMESPQFRQVLKEEIALKKELETLKRPLPEDVKARLYTEVLGTKNKLAYARILEPVLAASLPSLVRPLLQLLQRRVFVHEK